MYNGYLLKIGNVQVPMKYLVFSSYKVKEEPIITSEYYDGSYNKHIEYAPKNALEITVNIRPTTDSEYPDIAELFENDELTVEYFNPVTGSYGSGKFAKKGTLVPVIDRIMNNVVWYKEVTITLIRKVEL